MKNLKRSLYVVPDAILALLDLSVRLSEKLQPVVPEVSSSESEDEMEQEPALYKPQKKVFSFDLQAPTLFVPECVYLVGLFHTNV